MEQLMARQTKRLWAGEEKRSICFQTTAPGVSVAHVARRYAMNANRCPAVVCLQTMRGMIFKWLRGPR
jgi:transposase